MQRNTTIQEDTSARHKYKYENSNPIHLYVLSRFFDTVSVEIDAICPETTLEFGCGEGYFIAQLLERGLSLGRYVGIDLRFDAIDQASSLLPAADFRQVDLFDWPPQGQTFDLVIAAEVLEHLPEPEHYMERLIAVAERYLLLTVPHEPWFRLANLARGRDVSRFGNHPEHVNHWNPDSFKKFVSRFATVRKVITSFPFVILVAEPPAAMPGM
jgi:SAM-dependent methyltransferase